MALRRYAVAVALGLCAFALGLYVFLHDAVFAQAANSGLTLGECVDQGAQAAQTSDTDTIHDVSCAGFLN